MAHNGSGLTLSERDRRYSAIRERLHERGADCVIVTGSNLFYLSNGLPGEHYGLLTTDELPFTVQLNGRHLADIPASVIIDAQDWVKDIRGAFGKTDLIFGRIKELHFEQATIGLAGVSGVLPGGMSAGFVEALKKEFPSAKLVDVSDILADTRTLKSDEEVGLIEKANICFDLSCLALQSAVRPGMTGKEATQVAVRAMWDAGGDLESTIGVNFGATPKQNPILGDLCLSLPMQQGDIVTLTAHAEYKHYAGHSDQEISVGPPKQLHRDMFDAVLAVREEVLKAVKPGATQNDLLEVYNKAAEKTGFSGSPHSQIHQYGIDVPEQPGPGFVKGPRNWVLTPGMMYSISPTLVAKDGEDLLLGGTSLVITRDGYRELGDRKVEILVAG
ncbi:MAG: Aminopeptidase family protein [Chloroflexi bacterium]|nr:Aminopeptidase family protein [Chloroflexota bacterium]